MIISDLFNLNDVSGKLVKSCYFCFGILKNENNNNMTSCRVESFRRASPIVKPDAVLRPFIRQTRP